MSALPLVRVRLKYPDVETLVERFAPNVTRGGIFLASREPKAVGALIRFEVCLLSGTPVLAGEGKISWVKPFDPAAPTRPHGMGVSFTRIDPACRDMLNRLAERRETALSARRPSPSPAPAAGEPPPHAPELEAIDDTSFRRVMERARALAAKVDNLEDLLTREADEPVTVKQALADLPRYLQRRRPTDGAGTRGGGVPQTPAGRPTPAEGAPIAAASDRDTAPTGQAEEPASASTPPRAPNGVADAKPEADLEPGA